MTQPQSTQMKVFVTFVSNTRVNTKTGDQFAQMFVSTTALPAGVTGEVGLDSEEAVQFWQELASRAGYIATANKAGERNGWKPGEKTITVTLPADAVIVGAVKEHEGRKTANVSFSALPNEAFSLTRRSVTVPPSAVAVLERIAGGQPVVTTEPW